MSKFSLILFLLSFACFVAINEAVYTTTVQSGDIFLFTMDSLSPEEANAGTNCVFSGFYSYHNNDKEDRQWYYRQTCLGSNAGEPITWGTTTGWVDRNTFDQDFDTAWYGSALKGMRSWHENAREDRIYQTKTVGNPSEYTYTNCIQTDYVNDYDTLIDFRVPTLTTGNYQYSAGIINGFASINHNYYSDRRWKYTYCYLVPKHCSLTRPTLANGGWSCTRGDNLGYTLGATCTHTCNTGYSSSNPSATITCQSDSTWSALSATCNIKNCGTPAVVSQGTFNCASGTNYQNTCSFSCSFGYTASPTSITCQDTGTWSATPTCTLTNNYCDSTYPSAITSGSVSCTDTAKLGSVCTYTCNTGYLITSTTSLTATRTCGTGTASAGTWNGGTGKPSCTQNPSHCPTLATPTNGNIAAGCTSIYNAACTLGCNLGYKISTGAVGATQSTTCSAAGTWTTSTITCSLIPNYCSTITLTNGVITSSPANYVLGASLSYSCNAGYNLVNNRGATCISSTTSAGTIQYTSTTAPSCDLNNNYCPTLTAPTNGNAPTCTSQFSILTSCTFSCQTGYTLSHTTPLTCSGTGASGSWNVAAPTCIQNPTFCPAAPAAPTNGGVAATCSNRFYTATCTYTCNPGYTLSGSAVSTCGSTGTWSAVPICVLNNNYCSTLANPSLGTVSCTQAYSVLTSCSVSCATAYEPSFSTPLTCRANATWSSAVPTCVLKDNFCPTPTAPTKGIVLNPTNGNKLGSVYSYSCNTGYILSGLSSTTCLINQTWSGPAPTCLALQGYCPTLTASTNGTLSLTSSFTESSVATFSCLTGYTSSGTTTSTCTANTVLAGVWTPTPSHSCTATANWCPAITSPVNGFVSYSFSNRQIQTVASFSCNPGYIPYEGVVTADCNPNKTWSYTGSTAPPTCIRSACSAAPEIPNGHYICNLPMQFESTCTATCDEGYNLGGVSSMITCQSTSTWSTAQANCTIKNCGAPRDLPNGYFECSPSTTFESRCVAKCNESFKLVSSTNEDSIECTSDGTWTSSDAYCEYVMCGNYTRPVDGETRCTNGTSYGSVCVGVCPPDHTAVGVNSMRCTGSGFWDATINSTCIYVSSSSTVGIAQLGGIGAGAFILLILLILLIIVFVNRRRNNSRNKRGGLATMESNGSSVYPVEISNRAFTATDATLFVSPTAIKDTSKFVEAGYAHSSSARELHENFAFPISGSETGESFVDDDWGGAPPALWVEDPSVGRAHNSIQSRIALTTAFLTTAQAQEEPQQQAPPAYFSYAHLLSNADALLNDENAVDDSPTSSNNTFETPLSTWAEDSI